MSADASDNPPSFEEAMQRLEQIVEAMESERLPLEAMLSSYEEGMQLLGLCRRRMDEAKLRVEQIQSGELVRSEAQGVEPAKPATRSARRRSTSDSAAEEGLPPAAGSEIRLF